MVFKTLRLFLVDSIFKASLENLGAIITSRKISFIFNTNFLVTSQLQATMPPKTLWGSVLRADSQASIIFVFVDTPHGLACFIMAIVGSLNSLISSYAASESFILL